MILFQVKYNTPTATKEELSQLEKNLLKGSDMLAKIKPINMTLETSLKTLLNPAIVQKGMQHNWIEQSPKIDAAAEKIFGHDYYTTTQRKILVTSPETFNTAVEKKEIVVLKPDLFAKALENASKSKKFSSQVQNNIHTALDSYYRIKYSSIKSDIFLEVRPGLDDQLVHAYSKTKNTYTINVPSVGSNYEVHVKPVGKELVVTDVRAYK